MDTGSQATQMRPLGQPPSPGGASALSPTRADHDLPPFDAGAARFDDGFVPDWGVARDQLHLHARTFAFGSRFLSPARRDAVTAAYAYCRVADDLVDGSAGATAETMTALDAWTAELFEPRHPIAVAFAVARRRYDIPLKPVLDLLDGVRQDLLPEWFATWDDLRAYCYRVAGTVGLIAAPIFGCAAEDALTHAVDLGIAMQLTNILRDVAEDAALGRMYLPLDDLARFGVSPERLLAGNPDGDITRLMRFEIARARTYYRSGRQGIPALCPSGRLTTIAISHLYSRILERIEAQDCDPFFGRAHLSTRRKLRAMPAITADFLWLQVSSMTCARFR